MIKYLMFTSVAVLASAAFAQSAPAKNPSCASKLQVKPVENGNGVFFDADCKVAYVLPPVRASVTIDAIAGTTYLSECDELADINASAVQFTHRLKAIAAELNNQANGGPGGVGPGGGGPFAGATAPAAAATPHVAKWTPEMMSEYTQVITALNEVKALLKTYDGLVGASTHFLYELKTQELVAAYRTANPSIHFEALPLSRAYLTFTAIEKGDALLQRPVLSMSVPGLGQLPNSPDPANLSPQGADVGKTPVEPVDLTTTRIFGGSLAGKMDLSLSGACPYVDSRTHKLPVALSSQDLTAHLSANLQYAYALQAARSYKAHYNLAVLVRKIMESSTSGGFFSTSTAQSYVDDEKTNDWFVLESQSNDPRYYYVNLVSEVKASLLDRVLKQIALAKVGGPVEVTGLTTPQANGASVAAGALHKCANFYCQAGGFVLDIGNAIFGSTSAVNSFIANNDYTSSDDVTEKTMLEFYGSAGAVGAKEQ